MVVSVVYLIMSGADLELGNRLGVSLDTGFVDNHRPGRDGHLKRRRRSVRDRRSQKYRFVALD